MFLARVTGVVVATQKVATMTGHKLLTVEPYRVDPDSGDRLVPTGRTFVVVDTLGAGLGEMVLICQGSSARLTPETEKLPIDAVVIGLVDTVVPDEDVLDAAAAWAAQFVGGPALALRAAKQAIDLGSGTDLRSGLQLERALFDGQIDLAVHSLKDLPTAPVEGLLIAAVPPRESTGGLSVGDARSGDGLGRAHPFTNQIRVSFFYVDLDQTAAIDVEDHRRSRMMVSETGSPRT